MAICPSRPFKLEKRKLKIGLMFQVRCWKLLNIEPQTSNLKLIVYERIKSTNNGRNDGF
jgi:hypothetical protein